MPPARHRRPSRLLLRTSALALTIILTTATPPAPAADQPPTAAPPEPEHSTDLARLFKFHAGGQAQALADAIERAGLDETSRLELRLLVREHLRRVDEDVAPAASAPGADTPLDDLLDRATDLARDFNDRRISAWLDVHPAAYAPVQEQIALAEAYERSTTGEPDAVVRAARRAGLASEHEAALRRTVTDAHERLSRAHAADALRLREAEAQAAPTLPPPPPDAPERPGPPENGAVDAGDAPRPPRASVERAPEPPDRPAPGAPRPPAPALSPEVRRLQLLDALALADAHTRAAAAGRDVRAEVELLTSPEHRKAMDAEMLRWYESQAAASEPPPDEPPPADKSPDANPPRPAPGKPSPPNNPRD